MMKSALIASIAAFGFVTAQASLNWSSTVGTLLQDVGGAPLTAGASSLGFFVQLIQDVGGDGPDATSSVLGNASTGVSGDDVVVDVSFLGSFSASGGIVNGQLNPQGNAEPHVDGARYFMRFWNARSASPTVNLGAGNEGTLIPEFNTVSGQNTATGVVLRYGDSEVFTASGAANTILAYAYSGPATGRNVTNVPYAVVVPEPTTAVLLSLGVAGLSMALKRRRRQV